MGIYDFVVNRHILAKPGFAATRNTYVAELKSDFGRVLLPSHRPILIPSGKPSP
jgi:hypothetical protein